MVRVSMLLMCSALVVPSVVFAQSSNGPAPKAGTADPAEIVVTARKRNERLIDVPTAATVLDGASIAERGGATTPVELFGGQASVRVLDTGTAMTNEISLRGSPTTRGTSGDPSVGLFRDGGYIGGGGFSGRSFTRIDMFDIGRVEILKGTQGALYGRNAVGGAVNIVSAKPEFENSGSATARYAFGNDQLQLQGVANVQLSDKLAMRLGVDFVQQTGGFFRNSFLIATIRLASAANCAGSRGIPISSCAASIFVALSRRSAFEPISTRRGQASLEAISSRSAAIPGPPTPSRLRRRTARC